MLRLRRKRDIERTFQEGRRFYSPSAILHARRRHPQEGLASAPRLAVVAGRRFRSAVVRNRARRILREACRLALANTQAPWDLLLVARPHVLTLPPPARLQAVTELLRQADIPAEKAVVRV
ncbi:MAG: ribonuclease P protein component [Armatimonadota bacterium]|nr:MAG: ribonuclease P protein component [Armatimonadota bacterium]